MTFTINADFFKRWWPALLPAVLATYNYVAPHLQSWVIAHPSAAVYVSALMVFVATILKSPLPSQNGTAPVPASLQQAIAKARSGK